jgi:hypothetical protein
MSVNHKYLRFFPVSYVSRPCVSIQMGLDTYETMEKRKSGDEVTYTEIGNAE